MATYDINSLPSKFAPGDIINCPYSGGIKSITLPKGSFKLECWGARGGGGSTEAASPANGGYSRGDYSTDGNSMLYLVCGEHGYADKNCERRTYNGGGRGGICGMLGSNTYFGSGGGATHIATQSGVLSELSESRNSIIMVAGGGSTKYSGNSGGSTVYLQGNACGGGEAGGDCGLAIAKSPGSKFSVNRYSTAGTQTGGGTSGAVNYNGSAVGGSNGSFGAGGDGYYSDSLNVGASGGGGGYYGGGGGSSLWILDLLTLRNIAVYGSGGSGYISSALQNAVTVQEQSTSSNPDSNNHGYIRITVLSIATPTRRRYLLCGSEIKLGDEISENISVTYGSRTLVENLNGSKTLLCRDKYMANKVYVGTRSANCANTIMPYHLVAMLCYGDWMTDTVLRGGAEGCVSQAGWCVTPFLPVPDGCTSITIEAGGTHSNSILHEFDGDFGYLSYWGGSANPRTFSFDYPAQIKYIRASFLMASLADCYIRDNTHGIYIFRGGNV